MTCFPFYVKNFIYFQIYFGARNAKRLISFFHPFCFYFYSHARKGFVHRVPQSGTPTFIMNVFLIFYSSHVDMYIDLFWKIFFGDKISIIFYDFEKIKKIEV